MIGTLLNVCTVVLGSAIGLALGHRLPDRVRGTAMQALGLVVLFIGIQTTLKTENVLILLASLVVGGLVGASVRIEDGLERLGLWLERRFAGAERSEEQEAIPVVGPRRISTAFVTSSLVFCVGPMTILGSIQDGLTGDFSTLAVKSMLDFFAAVAFSSTLGPGVLLSAVTVLVYQGGLTLSASLARAVLTEPMVTEMTAAGGLLILGIGLRLLEIRKLPVADLLPALIFAPALSAVFGHWPS